MDRKSIVIIVLCFVVILLWQPMVMKLWPPKPAPASVTNAPPAAVAHPPQGLAPSASPAEAPRPQPRPAITFTNLPEETLALSNSNARYVFTSRGGGIKSIELLDYVEEVGRGRRAGGHSDLVTLNQGASVPTLAILEPGAELPVGDYKLSANGDTLRAEGMLANGLALVKEYELSTNYLVNATVRIENRSGAPVALPSQEWVVGTATPLNAQDNGSAQGLMWYNGSSAKEVSGASTFSSTGFMCTPRTPPAEYRAGDSNVVWAAAHNQFFALALVPQHPAEAVVMRKLDLPRPSERETQADSRIAKNPAAYETMMVYPATTIPAGESLDRRFLIFAGPKEYRTLATISAVAGNNLDAIMGYSGFFGWFSKALLLSMNWLHATLALSYGWAIIAITVIIKVLFWPLTQASTRSMKRMQALQPQMKAIQEKYKEDPAKMNRKTMEFMRENKVSPLGGCLPMLLQMPVFIGFFYMIRSAIELRGASFLWVPDLSRPDTIWMIPGLGFPLNLLPLIMGATMLWQARLTPPSPGMDPTQAKIMRYMPLMFMLFLYNFSAGLTLYWTVQNILTIIQTKLTKTTEPQPAAVAVRPKPVPPQKRKK